MSSPTCLDYWERLGFLRTDILPRELEEKIGRRMCDAQARRRRHDLRPAHRAAADDRGRLPREARAGRPPAAHAAASCNPHISRELGCDALPQVREPAADRRLQGARRRLPGGILERRREAARHHRRLHRQSRAVARLRRQARWRALRHRDAGGGEPVEGELDAGAGRRCRVPRRKLRGGARLGGGDGSTRGDEIRAPHQHAGAHHRRGDHEPGDPRGPAGRGHDRHADRRGQRRHRAPASSRRRCGRACR